MKFNEKFNEYIRQLDCTASEIAAAADISASTVSRYRSGERVPEMGSEAFEGLCFAIAKIAADRGKSGLDKKTVCESFILCDDFISTNREQFRQNFNALISVLNINLNKLCRCTNYDISTVFRFRNGTRQPADPNQFASDVASYLVEETEEISKRTVLAELIGCAAEDIADGFVRLKKIKSWLLEGESKTDEEKGSVSSFLDKLDGFDLNKFIKDIHFDEMKVPTVPFQLPTSKMYYGLEEMMQSELDFIKATVLSKSQKPVTLYSDMPMTEMAKDPKFPKKWMYGMALLLKKGLHLNNIHNIDRPFDEMMLGLESWIPMYMTGQISPYYLKNPQGGVFHHFIRVSGAAALSGEAVVGHQKDGRYYLSKTKEDISYYQKRADSLLENAFPLMDIYRADGESRLNAFILSAAQTPGKRRSILSVPPLCTMDVYYLEQLLERHGISDEDKKRILKYAAAQRKVAEQILQNGTTEDGILRISKAEFEENPLTLPLSGMFYEKDIHYTYEEYCEHIKQTEKYAREHANYSVNFSVANPFRNLQIIMHEDRWVLISKGNAPAIHFVIHHPKLRSAIENFVPPVLDE